MRIPTSYDDVQAMIFQIVENRDYLDCEVEDSLNHGMENKEVYKKILVEVLKDKPKRVVDIGSNLNQYAYLFTNEGIQYIGIDLDSRVCPLVYPGCVFIGSAYEQVKEWFKDDVVISNLCVGYFIKPEDVLCKRLILGQDVMNSVGLTGLVKMERRWVRVPHRTVAIGFVRKKVVEHIVKEMQSRPVSWEVYQSVFGGNNNE